MSSSASGDGVTRKTRAYHPAVWDDYFINHADRWLPSETQMRMEERCEELKETIKNMLRQSNDLEKIMDWIDAIQLMGVDYHFEKEIDQALSRIHYADFSNHHDLYIVALRFRLLRQQRYYLSPDIFDKFKDEQGNFKASLKDDARGLLSLYNAAYLGIHGENILDEAITFTNCQLTSLLSDLEQPLSEKVSLALESPFFRRMKRRLARNYISIYEKDEARNDAILELAKLDFNLLQSLHRQELKNVSHAFLDFYFMSRRWWKDIGLIKSLNYARDRMAECYYWIIAVYYEPYYSRARLITTKVLAMISIMDDTYDNYSTQEESKLINEAIQRWDHDAVHGLPTYIKEYYIKLINMFNDFKSELAPEEEYRIPYIIDQVKLVSRFYYEEAKWGFENYVPTVEDHLRVSIATTGYLACTCASFVGMGQVATKQTFEWLATFPKLVKATSLICRIMVDINTHEIEQQRGHPASSIECYMKEHNTSAEEACQNLSVLVQNAWKDINSECLTTDIPFPLTHVAVNFARAMEDIHKHIDAYTVSNTGMKDAISVLFVEPVSI